MKSSSIIYAGKEFLSFSLVACLVLFQISFSAAQTLETNAPTTATPPADTAPVEETITPPADTTAPEFISIAAVSAEETRIHIIWTTDEPAYGFVEYGETTNYRMETPQSASAALDHTVTVTGLSPGTAYHYRIVAEDENGNKSYSKDRTFETTLELIVADNVPPEIQEISVDNITASGATINWLTDELAQGKIEYGKTAEYGTGSPLADEYATEHSQILSGLEPDTEYHYRIIVQDESGNETVSPDEIFITDPLENAPPAEEQSTTESESSTSTSTPEENATSTSSSKNTGTSTSSSEISDTTSTSTAATLAISHVETTSIGTSSATIIWKTSKLADAKVLYGQGETYGSSSPISTVFKTSHEITLRGLAPGTNYFYKVISKSASGEQASKGGFEFNTLFLKKATISPPVLSGVRVESIATSSATILFDTNTPATGEIRYGTSTSYRKTDGGHTVLLTAHSHPLSSLTPNTLYNFVAVVRDAYGNETIYENQTFKTREDASQINHENTPAKENTSASGEAVSEETVEDETTEAPERSAGVSGGYYSYTHTKSLKAPKLIKAEALDGQTMFVWNPQKPQKAAPGSTQIRTNMVIVRSSVYFPDNPTSGKIVYKGNSGLFSDTGIENGKVYYYSLFLVNQFNSYSHPIHFKVIPHKEKKELELEVMPPIIKKNPIYTFPRILRFGDKNKHVEHLQVLLASEPSLYPHGFITGYLGPLTERAIKAFQKRYNLSITGVADNATLRKLEKLSSIEKVKEKTILLDNSFPRDLMRGLSGEDVERLQQFLIDVDIHPQTFVTGYFGPLTQSALAQFQKDQNITHAAGYFGPLTKKRILNLIRLRNLSF